MGRSRAKKIEVDKFKQVTELGIVQESEDAEAPEDAALEETAWETTTDVVAWVKDSDKDASEGEGAPEAPSRPDGLA
jgi:hypothetical protein